MNKEKIWTDERWVVRCGELPRHPGRPRKTPPLFHVVGEKLPFEALDSVRKHVEGEGISGRGVYMAHDSTGTARYVGHGDIFGRLKAQWNKHPLELQYFSFYVVEDKKHEREIETLIIRAAGPELHFNTRKKRVGLTLGSIRDYEDGTLCYVREGKRGKQANNA